MLNPCFEFIVEVFLLPCCRYFSDEESLHMDLKCTAYSVYANYFVPVHTYRARCLVYSLSSWSVLGTFMYSITLEATSAMLN